MLQPLSLRIVSQIPLPVSFGSYFAINPLHCYWFSRHTGEHLLLFTAHSRQEYYSGTSNIAFSSFYFNEQLSTIPNTRVEQDLLYIHPDLSASLLSYLSLPSYLFRNWSRLIGALSDSQLQPVLSCSLIPSHASCTHRFQRVSPSTHSHRQLFIALPLSGIHRIPGAPAPVVRSSKE